MSKKSFEIQTLYTARDKTARVISGMQSRIMKFAAAASMALRKINRVTGRISQGLGKFLRRGAIVGAGAVGLLFHGINKTAEAMDALAKKTRAINFPIEQFQEFRFVAEQSGVSAELFDKSMIKFTKTVGEAKAGYGTMLTALKKTNPQLLKQLKNTDDVSKAFELYLGAIRNTPGAMNKAALATAGFGRSGTTMINMAALGAEQLEKLRAQMRKNGIVTAEQARRAEEYNDMMNRLGLTVKGFAVDVISPLLPKLTDLADRTRQWMVENRGVIKQRISEFLAKLPGYIDKFKQGMSDVVPLLKAAVGFLGKVAKFVKSVDWGTWGPRIVKLIALFYALRVAIRVSSGAMKIFTALAAINLGPMRKFASFMGSEVPTSIGKGTKALGLLKGSLGAVTAAVAGWQIGTLIHEKLVDPLMQAQDRIDKMLGSLAATQRYGLGKLSEGGLKSELKTVQKARQATKDTPFFLDPLGLMVTQRKHALHMQEKNIRAELATRYTDRNLQDYFQGGGPTEWGVSTQVQSSEHKEKLEVTIMDTTGKAQITKGKPGKNVHLVHTGAVP